MVHPRCTTSLVALAALAVVMTAVPASAQTTYFAEDLHNSERTRTSPTNSAAAESEFLSRLDGVGTETFEGLDGRAPLDLEFVGAGNATLNGGGKIVTVASPTGTNNFGRYPISGSNFWETDAGTFRIDFENPVAAFGFYGVDVGDFASQLFVNLVGVGGMESRHQVQHTLGSNASTGGSIFFWGFIDASSPFTSVRFEIDGVDDTFAFDDMTIGSVSQVVPPTSVVPEPGTVLLLATGLAGLGVVGLRRRRQAIDS